METVSRSSRAGIRRIPILLLAIWCLPVIAVMLICALSREAVSQTTEKSAWDEPASFLGVKLGEPLSVPVCVPGPPQTNAMCWKIVGTSKGMVVFEHAPDLGFKYYLMGITNDEQVPYSLSIQTKTDNFAALKTMLIERYGPASKSERQTVQNRAGASFANEVLTWEGPNLKMELRQLAGSISNCAVYVTDKSRQAAARAKTDAETRSKASAF
ncbi:hypothetical protein AWB79_06898 [Caballeronia hypogeia]|uniref:Uncharacterized protein n=1 Tax=Caballeronia hypogeia TaxID=1777140 RepID=A0A158DEQ7_9BURK|nr:hypothetical protein [Caballeronia hypogeia]SAK93031.1 hypothetical protein AWB79_06898 [Caballeronia hypogeia]